MNFAKKHINEWISALIFISLCLIVYEFYYDMLVPFVAILATKQVEDSNFIYIISKFVMYNNGIAYIVGLCFGLIIAKTLMPTFKDLVSKKENG